MVASQLWWPVLVVAVMLGGGWAIACPQSCSCRHQRNLLSANCSSLPYNGGKVEALTLLPRDTPVELSDGQFNLAKHLKYLNLKNSSIYFVHKKAFYGAKKILEIDLSFNYIEELDPTVFQHLINLTRLSLRGNPIHLVPEMPFLISNSLSHLDIGQCKIKTIPRGIFYELKRLTYLSLDGNHLKSIVYNSLPKGLKYLDLSNNHIVNVPTEVISALTNIGRLGLTGNPINCTCSLMNFQDWLSGKGVIFEGDVLCNSPSKYKGVSWSKVDENKLCLIEAKREEMHYPRNSFMKNRLYKEPFNYKHFYLEENVQSDQPGLVPDSQVEVFMKNDQTLAMGEMMRDEENTKDEEDTKDEKEKTHENKDSEVNKADGKDPVEIKTVEVLSVTNNGMKTSDEETIVSKEEITLSPKGGSILNNNAEIDDLNSHQGVLNKENIDIEDVILEKLDQKVNTSDTKSNILDSTTEIGLNNNTNKELDTETIVLNQTQSSSLSENNPVEFKTMNEEELEVDEFKKEGLFHVVGSKYRADQNSTFEESTVMPEIEETTEDEFSGHGPILDEDTRESYEDITDNQNVTSTTETNNGSILEETVRPSEEEVVETVSPSVKVLIVFGSNENQQNASTSDIDPESTTELLIVPHKDPVIDQVDLEETKSPDSSHVTPDNSQVLLGTVLSTESPKSEVESVGTSDKKSQELNEILDRNKEDKVKEMAGAEVVMFCVAILVICLVLYSIYKCRSSKNSESIRNTKDVESNRGTELQDMASLLPKSQEDKKNNMKYDDKAPSSETVKLLTEQNENETVNFMPNPEVKNKIEDKNSLNNNTPNSPSKTPLIKTETPATPIQRTKVKVGIIPDSIPRTPIFLQKTYNGTKNV